MALQLMDTFTTFVDSLAESLDDHDVSGEDIAARAHLSRFHFDRVVSASPARRRRACGDGSCSSEPRSGSSRPERPCSR